MRRVPTPSSSTPRSFAVAFRRYMEDEREKRRQRERREDALWRSRDNSAQEADPVLRERRLEEALRISHLYQLASSKTPSDASAPSLQQVRQCDEIFSCRKKPLRVPKSLSRPLTALQMPTSSYSQVVVCPSLEKERAEKPHAIAHAQRDTMSIGYLETQVHSMLQGAASMENLVSACESAALVFQLSQDPILQQLEEQARQSGSPSSASSSNGKGSHNMNITSIPRSGRAQLLKNFAPLGRELERVARVMKRESGRESATSFDALQAARLAAKERLSNLLEAEKSQLVPLVQRYANNDRQC